MPARDRERDRDESWRGKLTRGMPLAVLLAAGLLVVYRLLPVLELLAIAMLLALVIRTALNRLRETGLGTWMSVAALLGFFAAFGAFVWFVLAPNVLKEVDALVSTVPAYADSLAKLARRLPDNTGLLPSVSSVSDRLEHYLSQAVSSLPNLLLDASHAAASVIAVFILALFMSHSPDTLVSGVLRFVPPGRRKKARKIIGTLEENLRGWMVGAGLAMLFIGVCAGVGLWILGAPLPITFGLLAGLLNVVPYIGSIVAALLPALLALTISPLKAVLVLALFVILNQIDGYVIQPMVMGHEVRLHPVVVLISFLVFGRLLGATGLLLAVPAAVFLTTLANEILPKDDLDEETPDEEVPPTVRNDGHSQVRS